MKDTHNQRKWDREEVVILVVEYYRTKKLPKDDIVLNHIKISDFLRKREEIITGKAVSNTFRDYAGIHMQSMRIQCLDPDTKYSGMRGTKLQKKIVQEYLFNPKKLEEEADSIYSKYGK